MGSIGPAEILVVLVVALIVLGPTRLPEAARSVGKAVSEFRRVTSGFQAEVREAFAEPPPSFSPPPPEPSPPSSLEPVDPGTRPEANEPPPR